MELEVRVRQASGEIIQVNDDVFRWVEIPVFVGVDIDLLADHGAQGLLLGVNDVAVGKVTHDTGAGIGASRDVVGGDGRRAGGGEAEPVHLDDILVAEAMLEIGNMVHGGDVGVAVGGSGSDRAAIIVDECIG